MLLEGSKLVWTYVFAQSSPWSLSTLTKKIRQAYSRGWTTNTIFLLLLFHNILINLTQLGININTCYTFLDISIRITDQLTNQDTKYSKECYPGNLRSDRQISFILKSKCAFHVLIQMPFPLQSHSITSHSLSCLSDPFSLSGPLSDEIG